MSMPIPTTVAEAITAVQLRLVISNAAILRARTTEYGLAATDNEKANMSREEAEYEAIRPAVRRILLEEVRRRMRCPNTAYLFDGRERAMLLGKGPGNIHRRPFSGDCSDKHLAAMAVRAKPGRNKI